MTYDGCWTTALTSTLGLVRPNCTAPYRRSAHLFRRSHNGHARDSRHNGETDDGKTVLAIAEKTAAKTAGDTKAPLLARTDPAILDLLRERIRLITESGEAEARDLAQRERRNAEIKRLMFECPIPPSYYERWENGYHMVTGCGATINLVVPCTSRSRALDGRINSRCYANGQWELLRKRITGRSP